ETMEARAPSVRPPPLRSRRPSAPLPNRGTPSGYGWRRTNVSSPDKPRRWPGVPSTPGGVVRQTTDSQGGYPCGPPCRSRLVEATQVLWVLAPPRWGHIGGIIRSRSGRRQPGGVACGVTAETTVLENHTSLGPERDH